jgi:hypothetical protein
VTAVWLGGCNSAWGVDDLEFDALVPAASSTAAATGGGGGGGSGGGAAAGGGGAAPVDCSGDFGVPAEALLDPRGDMHSVAIARGETELFYVAPAALEIRHSVRQDAESFPLATTDAVLSAACSGDLPTLDVSEDGLRAYVACQPADDTLPVRVVLAVRPTTNDAFVVRGVLLAELGFSVGVAPSELVLTASGRASPLPVMSARPDPSADFGAAEPIPGIEAWVEPLSAPVLAGDDLTLFGHVTSPALALGHATRPSVDDAFGAFVPIPTGLEVAGSPDVTPDCRAVYFSGAPVAGEPLRAYVMRR